MRKVFFVLICAALVFAAVFSFTHTVFSIAKQDAPDRYPSPGASAGASGETDRNPSGQVQPVQPHNAKLLNLDLIDLQNAIYEAVGTKNISAPSMYETYPIDIFFLPTGEVTQCRTSVWVLDSEIGGDYVLSNYQSSGLPGTPSFDIACTVPGRHFAKELFDFDFSGFEALTSRIGSMDLQAILDHCISDIPYGYRLVMGPIPAEIIDSRQVSCTAFDLSSGSPAGINLSSLSRIPDTYYLEYDVSSNYYALLPYYPAGEMPGYSVPPDRLMEFDGPINYAAPDGGNYNLNNIVLIFPDGVS